MDLHELRVAARLIDGLAKRALFAEKQMVALEGQCAEWQRIADDLKAERNELRSTTIDTATVDALTAELRKEREAHAETAESLAFRLETERLQMGKDVERLTKERDGLLTQVQDMRAEIERLKKPRQHPVKVGESVRRTTEGSIAPIGTLGRVLVVWSDAYQVELRKGFSTMWAFDDCTPCDPPPEASHDTPEGKQAAESVIRDDRKTEPKPGDTVRLVRVPTCNDYGHAWILEWGAVGNMGKVCKIRSYPFGNVAVVDIDARLSYEWPLSCVEVVKGGDK